MFYDLLWFTKFMVSHELSTNFDGKKKRSREAPEEAWFFTSFQIQTLGSLFKV
jgi:hypothetical protein